PDFQRTDEHEIPRLHEADRGRQVGRFQHAAQDGVGYRLRTEMAHIPAGAQQSVNGRPFVVSEPILGHVGLPFPHNPFAGVTGFQIAWPADADKGRAALRRQTSPDTIATVRRSRPMSAERTESMMSDPDRNPDV